ncbi:UDP-N-acetylmuramoyl-tripeptide--D-alanyl-D-alanine ligase, partial [Algoriphagus aestuarii]|nr:UDP-N-acetylmuramoyl-tripeptide--D-alanyl-D-alanine ligase [Algoriphagus aestuarii]
NILAAVAVGDFFDVSTLDINQAIAGYQPSNQRSQIIDTAKGNRIIGDYYNANASSMTAALENFALVEDSRPKTLILGDMYELGEATAEEHRRIIE